MYHTETTQPSFEVAASLFSTHSSHHLLAAAIAAGIKASERLISLQDSSLSVQKKLDDSPLTKADMDSHHIISSHLKKTQWPILSEEDCETFNPFCETYWCIDPLDGTKDYLANHPDYTVNIALIHRNSAILGVVTAPGYNTLYYGIPGQGAYKTSFHKDAIAKKLIFNEKNSEIRIVNSRFHPSPDITHFMNDNAIKNLKEMGSSLKYCGLAEGLAEVSPRLVGSSEWDTAASQAILEAAGGHVLDWHTLQPLLYGKQKWRNPRFIALRAPYTIQDFNLRSFPHELL